VIYRYRYRYRFVGFSKWIDTVTDVNEDLTFRAEHKDITGSGTTWAHKQATL